MQYSILDSYKKDILENKTMTTKCKRILETSIDLFAKNGYSNTSTSEIAKIAGGKGGGRPNMAQAGATDATKIDEALSYTCEVIKSQVK
ncbi:MAG: DHHA1 domain-containing protein [Intestinibacter bartlettii]|uniref:DHHA1 domain-containing protein n=1 Tax=Intestinibacter bartlettii TaxID=261299 RepID=UPI0028FEE6D6|nr:DHHA1 domain-containing protein [Intestinibacter bartlettii]MDU2692932.1 DHHA1 domain-containing protein [Intestinibacter bartlettii]